MASFQKKSMTKRSQTTAFKRPAEDVVPLNFFSESIKDMETGFASNPFPHIKNTKYLKLGLPCPESIKHLILDESTTQDLHCNHVMSKGYRLGQCIDCLDKSAVVGSQLEEEEDQERRVIEEDEKLYPTIEEHVTMLHGCGVNVAFLLAFTFDHDCWAKPTWWVNRHIIKEATKHHNRCRYVHLPGMERFTGPAQVFVSHCWGAVWGDVVLAACHGASMNRLVWIDLFAVRQWPGKGGSSKIGADLLFRDTLEKCTAMIVSTSEVEGMLHRIPSSKLPAFMATDLGIKSKSITPFFRLWCNVEIAHGIFSGTPVIIKAGKSMFDEKTGIALYETTRLNEMMENITNLIDVETSAYGNPDDFKREIARIRDMEGGNGIALVNETVAGVCSGAVQSLTSNVLEVDSAVCGEWDSLLALNNQILQVLVEDEGPTSRLALNHAVQIWRAAASGGRTNIVLKLLETWSQVLDDNMIARVINESAAIWGTSYSGHIDVLQILLSVNNVNVDAVNVEGSSALAGACQAGKLEAVDLLLEFGASVNSKSHSGETPLYAACSFGNVQVVERLLLIKDIQIDTPTAMGVSPFWKACQDGCIEIIRLLLSVGDEKGNGAVDVNRGIKRDGCTPLFIACAKGHSEVVKLLLSVQGIKPHKMVQGTSPLQLAQHYWNKLGKQAFKDIVTCLEIQPKSNVQSKHQKWCRGTADEVGLYTTKECDKSHGLVRFTTPANGFSCDLCGCKIAKGLLTFGCDLCNWDSCKSCVTSEK